MNKKNRRYTPQQVQIIRQKKANEAVEKMSVSRKKEFPKKFPFWARLKISKNRPTLVIDETQVLNKKNNQLVDGFVHREVIHTEKSKDYEKVVPNPDPKDPDPMYLKRPRKLPKTLFKPHEGGWTMPEELRKRYEKNNK